MSFQRHAISHNATLPRESGIAVLDDTFELKFDDFLLSDGLRCEHIN